MISPLQEALEELHQRFQGMTSGSVATYIPELGLADPNDFAICVATVDGHVYTVGDAGVSFTIQSISKPFVYALALQDIGVDAVMEKVAVEPSGEAFNAISLEPATGRPRNPMINAGAIATAGLVAGADSDDKLRRMIETLSGFAGRKLPLDEAVYVSERDTGHRNRAIAYLLRNANIVGDDVDQVVDRYFKQCSLLVTAEDLAIMAATLAAGGINPRTRDTIIDHAHVESVLSVMSTCGMYDYAGSWVYRVGMPAKSGVAGGVIAVLPGQLGIGVYSPALDEFGNSVRGVAVCEAFSREFGLHLLRPPINPGSAVLTAYPLSEVSSKRRRTDQQMRALVEHGDATRVIRLQGMLVLSTAEVALRRAIEEASRCTTIVFDCQRVQKIDGPVCRLFSQFVRSFGAEGGTVVFSGLREGEGWEPLLANRDEPGFRSFANIDLALEWCEDRILDEAGVSAPPGAELRLDEHPMMAAFSERELRSLSAAMERHVYPAGTRIIRQGDASDALYFLAAGDVSVNLNLADGGCHRVATMGPGGVFGELALLDDEPRTADVDAETEAVCFVLCLADIASMGVAMPGIRLELAQQLARNLAARLRRADSEIAALAT
jgi:glutaminase